MLSADPRCAELKRWLASLPPRTELLYRLALRGVPEYCRGDRAAILRSARPSDRAISLIFAAAAAGFAAPASGGNALVEAPSLIAEHLRATQSSGIRHMCGDMCNGGPIGGID
jgi:hypothetical protein